MMINLCDKESNAVKRSVSSTPNAFRLSTDKNVYFFSIANRQVWVLKPLRNQHWYFGSNGSIKTATCLQTIFSKGFEIIGKMLTGR